MKKKFLLTLLLTFMLVFTLTACGKVVVTDIEVSNQKTEFAYGEDFSLGESFEIKAKLDDKTTRVLLDSEYEVNSSNYNKLVAGTYEIVISYKEDSTIKVSYDVVVKDKVISGIAVSTIDAPKATYIQGQTLDLSVGKLIVSYEVGESDVINLNAEGVVVTGFDSTNPVNGQVLNVAYAGKSTTFTVNILAKEVVSISIKDAPKSSYYVGDDMDRTSGSILVTYNDGSGETILLSDSGVSINGFDTTTEKDDHQVAITYAGKTIYYTIDVVEPTLEEITLVVPTKTEYFIGESISLLGGKIVATYNNGSKDIALTDARVSVSGFDSSAEVEGQVVTVTFAGLSKTFTVNIIKKSATKIAIATAPTKTEYYIGDTIDLSGATIDVEYNDGSEDAIAFTDNSVTILGFDSSVANDALVLTIKVDMATVTFTVKIYTRAVQSIEIVSKPTKVRYFVGETIDLSGLAVKAIYPLHEENVNVEDVEVTGFDSSAAVEDQVVTVEYAGKTATFTVDVINKSVESIALETNPTKVNYYVGDTLDIAGGEIEVSYDDESSDVIAITESGVSVTGFDSTTAGEKQVTVTYKEKTTTFTVMVYAKEVKSIEVVTAPTKVTYFVGETLNTNGIEVKAVYQLHEEEVDSSELSFTGFDSTSANNEVVVTVEYAGKTATFTVSVIEKTATSIEINEEPILTYFVNDELDLTKGSIKVNYNDGSHEFVDLDAEGVEVTGFDASEAAEELELTITYKELTTTYTVEVIAKTPLLIAVNDDVQRVYLLDSHFNQNKGTIKVYYEGGLSEEIALSTQGVEVTGFDSGVIINELELTVTYNDLTATYFVSIVEEFEVVELSVSGLKTKYYQYEEFDYNTGSATITYEDGSTKSISIDELLVYNFENKEVKKYTLYISYRDARIEVEIEIIPLVVNSIEVQNTKTNYYKGETLNLSYIDLVCYTNNGEMEVSAYENGVVISGYDFNILGEQTLTITYEGVSDTFTINVNALSNDLVESVYLNSYPTVNVYSSKDSKWDLSGGLLYVNLINDNSINVDMTSSDVTTSAFDVSETGFKTVEVYFFGKTVSFDVEVVECFVQEIVIYTAGVIDNEYRLENDGSNEFAIELDGEVITDIEFVNEGYFGYWEYEILNQNGKFYIVCKYIRNDNKRVYCSIIIDVTMSNVNLELLDLNIDSNDGEIIYNEETQEYDFDTFCENVAFIGGNKFVYNGTEYDQYEIQDVDFAIGTHVIYVHFSLEGGSDFVIRLNMHVHANTIEAIKFDGVTYQTTHDLGEGQGYFLFEVTRGSKHIAQIIYDDENYVAIINDKEYASGTDFELKMTYYINDYSYMEVEVYDKEEYEAYILALETYEIAMEPELVQWIWVEIKEQDFVKSIEVVAEHEDSDYGEVNYFGYYTNNNQVILNEDFGIRIDDFVKEIRIEMEEGYTYELLTNSKKDGYYIYGENEMQILVYNEDEELVRVVPFILNVRAVDNSFNLLINEESIYGNEVGLVITFDTTNPSITYSLHTSNNDIKLNAHFNGVDKVSRTGKALNGWYNYDLGYQEIYFSIESELGNRVYFKVKLFVTSEELNGSGVFTCLQYRDVEENFMGTSFSQILYIGDTNEITLPVGATVEKLTLISAMQEIIDADIKLIEDGKVLRIEAEIEGKTYINYYIVKQNDVTDITSYKLIVADVSNMSEFVYVPSKITNVESYVGSMLCFETFDGYADVVVEENDYLMYFSDKLWIFAKEGEFTLTFTITPANGDTSKRITKEISFNITLAEIFNVDLGDKVLTAYLGLQTLHESSDFKIISVQVMDENPTYLVAVDVNEDDVTITQEGNVRFVTLDIAHPGMDEKIRVSLDGKILESLEDVKLEIKTTSKGYDYVEFDLSFNGVNFNVVIIIGKLENGLTLELKLGEDTETFTVYEIETGIFYGDFMAINMGGMVMAEAVVANPDFVNQQVPPTTITGKVSNLGNNMLIFGTMDMENGGSNFENIVTPENQNNLTLELTQMAPGIYVVMGLLMEIDSETQVPISQTMLMVTISASGISMFSMMA